MIPTLAKMKNLTHLELNTLKWTELDKQRLCNALPHCNIKNTDSKSFLQNKDRTENTYNRVKDTTPGNLVPGGAMEDDEDSVRTTITPPTGTIISRWLYVTTVAAGLILVGATIIFIRKRVLVK